MGNKLLIIAVVLISSITGAGAKPVSKRLAYIRAKIDTLQSLSQYLPEDQDQLKDMIVNQLEGLELVINNPKFQVPEAETSDIFVYVDRGGDYDNR